MLFTTDSFCHQNFVPINDVGLRFILNKNNIKLTNKIPLSKKEFDIYKGDNSYLYLYRDSQFVGNLNQNQIYIQTNNVVKKYVYDKDYYNLRYFYYTENVTYMNEPSISIIAAGESDNLNSANNISKYMKNHSFVYHVDCGSQNKSCTGLSYN